MTKRLEIVPHVAESPRLPHHHVATDGSVSGSPKNRLLNPEEKA